MQPGEREGNVVLAEVVADRHLAAERIAPVPDGHVFRVVVEGVNEHRHAQAGPAEGVGHAAFVAEVRQRDEDAVNLAGVLLEQIGAFLRVFHGFDRAEFGCVLRQRDHADAEFFERGQDFLAPGVAEVGGKETAIADDDAEFDHG